MWGEELTRRGVPAALTLFAGLGVVLLATVGLYDTVGRRGVGMTVVWTLLVLALAAGVGVVTVGATSLRRGLVRLPLTTLVALAVVSVPLLLGRSGVVNADLVWSNLHVVAVMAVLGPAAVWTVLTRHGVP